MKKSKFTEEQIAFALKQADTGTKVPEICRQLGISQATFYAWRKKYGGMDVADVRRLKLTRTSLPRPSGRRGAFAADTNPFNPTTEIKYALKQNGHVTLDLLIFVAD